MPVQRAPTISQGQECLRGPWKATAGSRRGTTPPRRTLAKKAKARKAGSRFLSSVRGERLQRRTGGKLTSIAIDTAQREALQRPRRGKTRCPGGRQDIRMYVSQGQKEEPKQQESRDKSNVFADGHTRGYKTQQSYIHRYRTPPTSIDNRNSSGAVLPSTSYENPIKRTSYGPLSRHVAYKCAGLRTKHIGGCVQLAATDSTREGCIDSICKRKLLWRA